MPARASGSRAGTQGSEPGARNDSASNSLASQNPIENLRKSLKFVDFPLKPKREAKFGAARVAHRGQSVLPCTRSRGASLFWEALTYSISKSTRQERALLARVLKGNSAFIVILL